MKREMMLRRHDAFRRAVATRDIDDIQMTLGDFLMEARSLHDVIGNEGKDVGGFTDWWKEKKLTLVSDQLMNWAHQARIDDFHHGVPSIEVVGWQNQGGMEYDPTQRSDDKNLMMGDSGMFWISHRGQPMERIERAIMKYDNHAFVIRIAGLKDAQTGPGSIEELARMCEAVATRNQEVLHEAKQFVIREMLAKMPPAGPP